MAQTTVSSADANPPIQANPANADAGQQPVRNRIGPLGQGEIADLAQTAMSTWESGLNMAATDSQGGLWSFEIERGEQTGLKVTRTSHEDAEDGELPPEPKSAGAWFSQADMGRTDVLRLVLPSRLLAVATT